MKDQEQAPGGSESVGSVESVESVDSVDSWNSEPITITPPQVEKAVPSRTVVMKFGGTSVADAERARNAAQRIVAAREDGYSVVAVVSARGDTTDDLIALAREISPHPPAREMDMLLSTGERISAALLAMAISDLGHDAVSLTGSQAGIVTDTSHTRAKIVDIRPTRVQKALNEGRVVLVAGFQGVSTDMNVTTLGRGGSDTTAVALAAALGAEVCEIYTDVDGIYTSDPRLAPDARRIPRVSYEEMLEMSATGAKILMLRSVEFARRYGVALHVRSSFKDSAGTWILSEEENMEKAIVSAVTYALDDTKVTINRVPDRPGVAAKVFTTLAAAGVNVDVIIQNVSDGGTTDISFTIGEEDLDQVCAILGGLKEELGFARLETDTEMAKVSIVGAGMKTHPGVAAKMFRVLADTGANIEMISTSSIKVSCIIHKEYTERAVNALHTAFGLAGEGVQEESLS